MITVGDDEPSVAAGAYEQDGRELLAGADFGAVFGRLRHTIHTDDESAAELIPRVRFGISV